MSTTVGADDRRGATPAHDAHAPHRAAARRLVVARGRRRIGEELARLVVRTWDREGDRNAIMTLLRAATVEPAAAELMREFFQRRLYPPLVRTLGSPDAELRANLAASQLLGLGIARYVLRLEPLASMGEDEVVRWLGPALQRY